MRQGGDWYNGGNGMKIWGTMITQYRGSWWDNVVTMVWQYRGLWYDNMGDYGMTI